MMKLILSPWATAVVSAAVYLGATFAFWKTPAPKPAPVPDPIIEHNKHNGGPSWDFVNPEADQLIVELQEEKKALQKKEQDLKDLSARLESERSELNLVSQSVRELQTNFDQNVMQISGEETVNLKKLAKVYADMDPSNAGKIMQEMTDDSIIKIMVFMKDVETASVFEAMAKQGQPEARRAAMLSDRLRLSVVRNNNAPK